MARPVTPGSSLPGLAATARRLSGVVLLVEDEPSVRTVTRRMMEMRGLTVLLAETPEEALEKSATLRGPLDILLTDVQLPGKTGPELAQAIRETRPELKVVFISGYSRDDAFANSRDDGSAEFLQKPFSPAQLAEVLARVLAGASTTPPPSKPGDTQRMPPPDIEPGEKPKT